MDSPQLGRLRGRDLERFRDETRPERCANTLNHLLDEAENAARVGYRFLNSTVYIDEDLRDEIVSELRERDIYSEVDQYGYAYLELYHYESEDSEEDAEDWSTDDESSEELQHLPKHDEPFPVLLMLLFLAFFVYFFCGTSSVVNDVTLNPLENMSYFSEQTNLMEL